jgi:hypothetical protein
MKRLVLLGEGQGDAFALPVLVRRLFQEKTARDLYVDRDVIRTGSSGLVRWNKLTGQSDYSEWVSRVALAARRRDVGAVLAIYDGDFKMFPPGTTAPFCASTAAKSLAAAGRSAGAGKTFSLSVVFACSEYEAWLIAGAESLAGRSLDDGRLALPLNAAFPSGNPESHGKRWLEQNCPNYRETRDQAALTELLDFKLVRARKLRSFARLENALEQLLQAVGKGTHISTPS